MTADHGPLCANGVRCPDCGWPVPPEHDAAIAGRALREAADEIDAKPELKPKRCVDADWLRALAEQVSE